MPHIIQLNTAAVEERHRAQLIGDVMARQLAGGEISAAGNAPLGVEWQLAAIGEGMVIAEAEQAGMRAARGAAQVRDGDHDVSLFLGRRGVAQFEQNDRREMLRPGEVIVVAHARQCSSEWPDNRARLLRLPRSALQASAAIERAGGVRLAASTAAVALLTSYVDTVWSLALDGGVPQIAERHLGELATLVLAVAVGQDVPALGRGPAAQAARFAAMREYVARHHANPGLTMAKTAAAVGLSERTGYLVFAAAGVGFTELLFNLRIDRAGEALASGFAGRLVDLAFAVGFSDLSHFNRRFRGRFGVAPSDFRRTEATRR